MQNCITINRGSQSLPAGKRRLALGKRLSERRLNAPYRGGMVNEGMLNGEPAFVPLPLFREFFRVSGRFPRFKKPFKYTGRSRVNPESAAPAVLRPCFSQAIPAT
jgi:hypothetical protein